MPYGYVRCATPDCIGVARYNGGRPAYCGLCSGEPLRDILPPSPVTAPEVPMFQLTEARYRTAGGLIVTLKGQDGSTSVLAAVANPESRSLIASQVLELGNEPDRRLAASWLWAQTAVDWGSELRRFQPIVAHAP
jgi:hypothetical protein